MAFRLGKRSLANLQGVHPDLVAIVQRAIAITTIDFVVIEGLRTPERQAELLAAGASRTLKSRHLTGHAVDLAAIFENKVTWRTEPYHQLAPAVKLAASELGLAIEWGGDWTSFHDLPHWQLPWDSYPA